MSSAKLLILLTAFGCFFSACMAPDWSAGKITEARFRDGVPGKLVASVSTAEGLTIVTQAFLRSSRMESPSEDIYNKVWRARCFDLIGTQPLKGRWVYDPMTGLVSKTDPLKKPIYRFTDADRLAVNRLFTGIP